MAQPYESAPSSESGSQLPEARHLSSTDGERRPDLLSRRVRQHAPLVPLFILLVLWVWLFYAEGALKGGASGQAFGADFAMFIGAAQVVHDGGNPYDRALLYRTESRLLHRQHLPIMTIRTTVRVGNPPLFFWALSPLAGLPFQMVADAWVLILYALSVLAFASLLAHLGWRRWTLPTLFFMLMPQTIFGPFFGNVSVLVFTGIAFALVFMRRYPVVSGILLSVAWLKPPTALPIVLLIVLFHTHDRRALVQGFVGSSLTWLALTLVTTGQGSVVNWIHGLLNYSRDMVTQPDVASFAGLYIRDVPSGMRLSIEALSVAIAVICTALAWHRYRGVGQVPLLSVAWLWALWFLATPYAHFYDEIALTIPVLALIGRDARWVTRRESIASIYLAFASLLVISVAPAGIQLLWLPLVGIMLCLYIGGRSLRAATVGPTLAPA